MPVTIKDVAKAAGVSPSTVTRVIQNKSTISDETKKRVRKAMKELNYHPNLNARSLVSSYTPSLLLSIAEATISKVFPLPTTWASRVFPP